MLIIYFLVKFILVQLLVFYIFGFSPVVQFRSRQQFSTRRNALVAKKSVRYTQNFTWPPKDWSIFKTHIIPFHVQSNSLKPHQITMHSVFNESNRINSFREKYGGRNDIGCMIDIDEDENTKHGIKDYDLYEWFAEEINKLPDIPETGDIVNGTIIAWANNGDGVYIEYGGKEIGVMPLKETSMSTPIPVNKNPPLAICETVTAMLVGTLDGRPVLSIRRLQIPAMWKQMSEAKESSAIVNVTLTAFNKGGAMGMCQGLSCFVPRTHLVLELNNSIVGKTIQGRIIQCSPSEKKLIISQSLASTNKFPVIGTLVNATVTNILPYGVHIQTAAKHKGLMHRKQITNAKMNINVTEYFHIGQQIRVIIDGVTDTGHLSVSTKSLERIAGEILHDMDVVFERAEETLQSKKIIGGKGGASLGALLQVDLAGTTAAVSSLDDISRSIAGGSILQQASNFALEFDAPLSGNTNCTGGMSSSNASLFENENRTQTSQQPGKSRRASKVDSILETMELSTARNEKAQAFNAIIMKSIQDELLPLLEADSDETSPMAPEIDTMASSTTSHFRKSPGKLKRSQYTAIVDPTLDNIDAHKRHVRRPPTAKNIKSLLKYLGEELPPPEVYVGGEVDINKNTSIGIATNED